MGRNYSFLIKNRPHFLLLLFNNKFTSIHISISKLIIVISLTIFINKACLDHIVIIISVFNFTIPKINET